MPKSEREAVCRTTYAVTQQERQYVELRTLRTCIDAEAMPEVTLELPLIAISIGVQASALPYANRYDT